MTPPAILNKIKLLLKLTQSPNPFEADSAHKLAQGLIEKHNVSPEELESLKDSKPFYGEDELVFTTIGIIGWRQQLVLAIATHLSCQIVQEEIVPAEDAPHPFHYYAYGEPEDVKNVQFVFKAFSVQVERLVETECLSRGPVYIASYAEGVVEAIKQNITLYGIELPDLKKPVRKVEIEQVSATTEEIVKPKPAPADRRADVNAQSSVQDIAAYFCGLYDGRDLFLTDILELACKVEQPEQLLKPTEISKDE
jgi:hypothetical protein